MTDIISTSPTAFRRASLPRLKLRRIGIGAALSAIARIFGQALNLAYVDPFTSLKRRPPIIPDDDPDGRDPNW